MFKVAELLFGDLCKALPQHWIERVTRDLMERDEDIITFSIAKTPSGPIHVGVGRELVYCSVFEKLVGEQGLKTRFLFFVRITLEYGSSVYAVLEHFKV